MDAGTCLPKCGAGDETGTSVSLLLPKAADVFRIFAPSSAAVAAAVAKKTPLSIGPVADPGRMLDGGIRGISRGEVEALWAQKTRLDELFDAGHGGLYWVARQELFPMDACKDAVRADNRAGEKLAEIARAVGGLLSVLRPAPEETVFLDVCGGPGAWSKYLLKLGEKHGSCMRGFGFSLRDGTNPLSCTWYRDLTTRGDFTALWGEDGTGDVCSAPNIVHAAQAVGRTAMIIVADGWLGGSAGSHGQHLENYQEILSGRIILAELLIMLETVRAGGCFVCKIFDTFSSLTVSIICVVAALFEETFVVKPLHSRAVNSERYLVGRAFRPGLSYFDALLDAVRETHAAWPPACPESGPWSGEAPLSVPVPEAMDDEAFQASVRAMTKALCSTQTKALAAVIDRALELQAAGAKPPSRKRRRKHC